MKKLFRVATTAILFSLTACTQLSSERAYKMIGNSPAVVQAAFNPQHRFSRCCDASGHSFSPHRRSRHAAHDERFQPART
jgi:hypothetical protein